MNFIHRHTSAAVLSLAAWLPLTANAQDRVEPEQRDFTISSSIVPLGQVQVEAGAAWGRSEGSRRWTLGENLVRIPLAREVEVRFGLPPYLIEHADGRAVGFDDASVELRWRFHRAEAVDLALQADAMLPIGSRQVAERNAQPGLMLAATFKLSEGAELVLNAGGKRASQDGERFGQAIAAASLRVDIGERWNVLVETYGFNREERGGPSRRYAALGATYYIDRKTALYLNAGGGIGGGNDNRLAHIGIARRF